MTSFSNYEICFVITTTNRDTNKLFNCFLSCANQVIIKPEIIIINNSFTALQPEFDKWAEVQNNEKLVQALQSTLFIDLPIQNSLGLSRNLGAVLSHSKYLCFVSDDSVVQPLYAKRILEEFYKNPDVNILQFTLDGSNNFTIHSSSFAYKKSYVLNNPWKLSIDYTYNICPDAPELNEKIVQVNCTFGKHIPHEFTWNQFVKKHQHYQDAILNLSR